MSFKTTIDKIKQDIIDDFLKAENGVKKAITWAMKEWDVIEPIAEEIIKIYIELKSKSTPEQAGNDIAVNVDVPAPEPAKLRRKYNLKWQKHDHRDYKLKAILNPHASVQLPISVDLRPLCPPVFDQGQLGSCTANAAIAAMMMFDVDTTDMLSRLFQYYQERLAEGDVQDDSGASVRDEAVVLNTNGACVESLWPYSDDPSVLKQTPSQQAIADALTRKIGSYYSVPDVNGIKQVLALKQQPVCIGINVYDSFESDVVAKTGVVPIPDENKENELGGHAILVVGYDDNEQWFIVRNSWGEGWGDKGYCYIPYDFFTKGFASDFWVLQK